MNTMNINNLQYKSLITDKVEDKYCKAMALELQNISVKVRKPCEPIVGTETDNK